MTLKQRTASFALQSALSSTKGNNNATGRAFTSSSSYLSDAIPTFAKTSSPALNELLNTIRQQIFLPGYLPRNQRALVHKQKYHHILKSETPVVKIGNEQFQLKPSIPWKDVPNHWASVLEALRLMETDHKKWRNFYPLMMGMHHSGKKWTTEQMCKILRIVGERGSPTMIIEALKRGPTMGISVGQTAIVREAMWACRHHAVRNNWQEPALSNALRYVIQVGEILDQKLDNPKQDDPRNQPDVLAVIVELAAARAALHHDCRDEDGWVRRYTERLVSNLGAETTLHFDSDGFSLNQLDSRLLCMISLRNALLLADKVLGPDMPNSTKARTVREHLDQPLRNTRKTMHKGPKSLRSSARRSPSWICDSQRFTQRKRWKNAA